MIAGLHGRVEDVLPDSLLVNVGGVVYQVFAPSSTLSSHPSPGSHADLYTHLLVREDAWTLYGFESKGELRMFQLLLSVTGVGPRSAMALISSMSIDDLIVAVSSEDIPRLSSVTGVGKKIAGRIALELKSKIGDGRVISVSPAAAGITAHLLAALTSLGYSNADAAAAVRDIPNLGGMELEDALREALRLLSSKG